MAEKLAALTFGKALIIGVVLTAIYYFMFYENGDKLNAELTKVKSEITKNRNELGSIKKAIDAAKKFEVTRAQLGEEMDSIARAIPADITNTDLMLTLSNEAKIVGVEINKLVSIENKKPRQKNKKEVEVVYYEPISVSMEITGNFNQVMLFMANLTRLDKIITTNNLVMSSSKSKQKGTSGQNPDINLKTTVNAYKYVSPAPEPIPTTKKAKKK